MRHQILAITLLAMCSCLHDGNETLVLSGEKPQYAPDGTPTDIADIPSDDSAAPNPEIDDDDTNTTIPNFPGVIPSDRHYGYVHLTGIRNTIDGTWLTLYGTDSPVQNVWLSIDGTPKSVVAYNIHDSEPQTAPVAPEQDVVLLIDDSASMTEEVETIAAQLDTWARELASLGISLRTGYVAYEEGIQSVNGAYDLAPVDEIASLLKAGTGTDRVKGFGGSEAQKLQNAAQSGQYQSGYNNECAMVALQYAHDLFTFRTGANRVYINFCDDSNQPGEIAKWSVERLNPESDYWESGFGTVHTVFSGDASKLAEIPLIREHPWRMARYTGGTEQFVSPDFGGVNLTELTASQALGHSSILRFRADDIYRDGEQHHVKVTVKTPDGTVSTYKDIYTTFR